MEACKLVAAERTPLLALRGEVAATVLNPGSWPPQHSHGRGIITRDSRVSESFAPLVYINE
jgi:hypothetical protein